MEGRCSASVPGGMLRVVVSAPICQNAIRQTMEALISTSRPIIFKWLLAEECNQSITDKILLKLLSLPLALSLAFSLSLSQFLLISLFLSASPSSLLFLVKLGHSYNNKTLTIRVFNATSRQSRCDQWHWPKWGQLRSTSIFSSSQESPHSINLLP